MQLSAGTINLDANQEYGGVSLMSGEEEAELIFRVASGDVEAKLQLVKEHLDLVVEIAAMYASETGKPFPQMVQAGTLAVIKAADEFHSSRQFGFAGYVRDEIVRAMERIG